MLRFIGGLAVLMVYIVVSKAAVCESDCKCKVQAIPDKPNWKQCTWKDINLDVDVGLLKNCTINKKAKTSALKITLNAVIRMSGCVRCCKRWYITFNDEECQGPEPIDTVIYQNQDLNIHRGVTLVGYCNKIKKGKVAVAFHVGECSQWGRTYLYNANSYTGWNSVTRMIIEEVEMPDDDVENVLSTTY